MDQDYYDLKSKSKVTGFIPDKLYEIVERDPLPDDTKIVSELADRFLELKEINTRKPIILLHLLGKVARTSPGALWIVLEILSGGRDLDKSLSEKGKEKSFSKQAIHQKRNRDLAKLDETMPEVAKVLRTIICPGSINKPSKEGDRVH